MRRLVLCTAALCAAALPGLVAQDRTAPEALARALQQRYQSIADFSADFTQVYQGAFLRTETHQQGTLIVKRPGRMRWTYAGPVRKELVATGERVCEYDPSERPPLVQLATQDETSTPALFLAGRGDLVRDFTVAHGESPVDGAVALVLTPRTPDADHEERLIVAVDPETLQIRALVTTDAQGGESTLLFSNIRENRGIADREFEFRIPRGADVVDEDGRLLPPARVPSHCE